MALIKSRFVDYVIFLIAILIFAGCAGKVKDHTQSVAEQATPTAVTYSDAVNPSAPGRLTVETIAFPELTDVSRNLRSIPIKVHVPNEGGPFPVIVISHGAGGNWDTHYAQARHLASHGYAVLCVEHTGSNTQNMMRDAQIWANLIAMIRDSDEVLGRPPDISFALDRAEDWNASSAKLRGRLDMEHVGVMGHSFGAFTTMVICGMRPALNWLKPRVEPGTGIGPDLSDRRVDCGVALSPQGPDEPFFISESFDYLKVPLLGISGTNDQQQGGLPPETRLKAFTLWPAGQNKFIWISNARHLDFTDSTGSGQFAVPSPTREDVQTVVRAATLLFFNAHLKNEVSAQKLITTGGLKKFVHGSIDSIEVISK